MSAIKICIFPCVIYILFWMQNDWWSEYFTSWNSNNNNNSSRNKLMYKTGWLTRLMDGRMSNGCQERNERWTCDIVHLFLNMQIVILLLLGFVPTMQKFLKFNIRLPVICMHFGSYLIPCSSILNFCSLTVFTSFAVYYKTSRKVSANPIAQCTHTLTFTCKAALFCYAKQFPSSNFTVTCHISRVNNAGIEVTDRNSSGNPRTITTKTLDLDMLE